MNLYKYKCVLFDVDGVLRRGSVAIEGAAETLRDLRDMGKKVGVVTNNSGSSAADMQKRLQAIGVSFSAEEIVSAPRATAKLLADRGAGKTAFVLGSAGVAEELALAGIGVVEAPESIGYECDYLVVGACSDLNRNRLTQALRVALKGAMFVAVNRDRMFPGKDGIYPAAGAVVGAVCGMLGREPDIVVGKPSPFLGQTALELFTVEPAECLMVGDTLETDISMGIAAGMDTALVLTGNTTANDITPNCSPTFVISSVADLVAGRT